MRDLGQRARTHWVESTYDVFTTREETAFPAQAVPVVLHEAHESALERHVIAREQQVADLMAKLAQVDEQLAIDKICANDLRKQLAAKDRRIAELEAMQR